MKTSMSVAILCVLFLLGGAVRAQQVDVAFGAGTLVAPSAASASGNHAPQSIGGGTFLNFSGNFLIKHHFGVGGEIAWRASQNLYGGFQPFRPLFYDVNAVWAPPVGKRVAPELMAGIGAQSSRFYQPFYQCNYFSCTNYSSSNHFMGHFGGGMRFYLRGPFFIRPEAHVYLVNNNFEFSAAYSTRFGVSIGYTLGLPEY